MPTSLIQAQEHALPSLVSILVRALIEISVRPFPDPMTIWESVWEISNVNFTFRESQLSKTLHLSIHPISFEHLLEPRCAFFLASLILSLSWWIRIDSCCPRFLSVAMRYSFANRAYINRTIRVYELSISCQWIFLRREPLKDNIISHHKFIESFDLFRIILLHFLYLLSFWNQNKLI